MESGVKYVRGNLWPSVRFTDDADLNRQSLEWCDGVAKRRVHGTTGRRPWEMLAEERIHLGGLPERSALAPYLRDDRRVAHDGYVHWEGSCYGVPWRWAGATVQVGQRSGTVEIWTGGQRRRCILVPNTPASASPRPVSGKGCPGETAVPSRRPWQSR